MARKRIIALAVFNLTLILSFIITFVQPAKALKTGAEQLSHYVQDLQNKRLALVVNHTSRIGQTHLVDELLQNKLVIKRIFAPEHGFRGLADAGEKIQNQRDPKTGLPIVSLYGKNKKPTLQQLRDIDLIIFDIQDVGVRFYTYISTMHYVMEAAAEAGIPVWVLDRPNPNGDYIAGPVLTSQWRSFVGMHPIPLVHGLTVGELAQMIVGEGWLNTSKPLHLKVIPMQQYSHQSYYDLPYKPSPNLPNRVAIRLYPSLGLFEGTSVSVGRGTAFPFQILGFPAAYFGDFQFIPRSITGMSKYPPHQDQTCYGLDLRRSSLHSRFSLQYLLYFYRQTAEKEGFFNAFFNKLAGTETLRRKIESGWREDEILKSWENELQAYKRKRQNYLIYPD